MTAKKKPTRKPQEEPSLDSVRALFEEPAAPKKVVIDVWGDRSSFTCETCMWFVLKGEGPVGRCRKHAPTLSGYPVVTTFDFCGDHKLDERVADFK